jgi:hypothetical protein
MTRGLTTINVPFNSNPPADTIQTYGDKILSNLYASEPMVALVYIDIKQWHGAVVNYIAVGHFVVIKGMTTESSASARWVEVLNPFNNRYEYYKWSDFYAALGAESYQVFSVKSPYVLSFLPPPGN